jgi:TRAP-type C4-dicarboxylate transport system permease small subunit
MRKIINALGTLGGLAIAAMMLLILAEVLSRLFLGSSIEGTIEVVGIFLSLAVFLGFAPCEQTNHHIRVELLRMRIDDRKRFFLDLFSYILALLIVGVMAWRVGLDAYSSLMTREALPGADFEVPVYPAKISAFVGFLAFGLQLCLNIRKISSRPAESGFSKESGS